MKPGEKLHVIIRRSFEEDIRRHFVGEVIAANGAAVRIRGHAFVFRPAQNDYVQRPDLGERIVSLVDATNIVSIIPETVELEDLAYRQSDQGRLVMTDDKSFRLDINEFSDIR
jgi:hypothetical protein